MAEYLPDKEPSTSTLSEQVDIPEEIACPPCDKDLGKEIPSANRQIHLSFIMDASRETVDLQVT